MVTIRQGAPAKVNFTLAPGAAGHQTAELGKVFNEGIDAEKAGNHDDAIAKFTHAAELNPTCADCYSSIGTRRRRRRTTTRPKPPTRKRSSSRPDPADAYTGWRTSTTPSGNSTWRPRRAPRRPNLPAAPAGRRAAATPTRSSTRGHLSGTRARFPRRRSSSKRRSRRRPEPRRIALPAGHGARQRRRPQRRRRRVRRVTEARPERTERRHSQGAGPPNCRNSARLRRAPRPAGQRPRTSRAGGRSGGARPASIRLVAISKPFPPIMSARLRKRPDAPANAFISAKTKSRKRSRRWT